MYTENFDFTKDDRVIVRVVEQRGGNKLKIISPELSVTLSLTDNSLELIRGEIEDVQVSR